jgi:hypothetical protein
MPFRHLDGDVINEVHILAVLFDRETDVVEF